MLLVTVKFVYVVIEDFKVKITCHYFCW